MAGTTTLRSESVRYFVYDATSPSTHEYEYIGVYAYSVRDVASIFRTSAVHAVSNSYLILSIRAHQFSKEHESDGIDGSKTEP